mgnify:CR=1 FL=1
MAYIAPDPIDFENFIRSMHNTHGANLTPAQRAHIQEIIVTFAESVYKKYAAGQKEHTGDLWKKSIVLDELISETLDLVVYSHTLRRQLEDAGVKLGDPTLKD